jgi:putative membrane protein
MTTRWLVAATHLIFFAILLASIWCRGRALKGPLHPDTQHSNTLRAVFATDTVWGIAALVMLATGLLRAFAGLEKGSAYYLHEPMFYFKMACLAVIVLLEAWPTATLIQWRVQLHKGIAPDTARAGVFARISEVQTVLVIVTALAASAMARGIGRG